MLAKVTSRNQLSSQEELDIHSFIPRAGGAEKVTSITVTTFHLCPQSVYRLHAPVLLPSPPQQSFRNFATHAAVRFMLRSFRVKSWDQISPNPFSLSNCTPLQMPKFTLHLCSLDVQHFFDGTVTSIWRHHHRDHLSGPEEERNFCCTSTYLSCTNCFLLLFVLMNCRFIFFQGWLGSEELLV